MISRFIVLLTCLLILWTGSSSAGTAPGLVQNIPVVSSVTSLLSLSTLTSDLCEGTFTHGNTTIHFSSRPSGLTLSVLGINLLSFHDFGSFFRIDIGENVFLVGTVVEILDNVIDCTSNIVNLPELNIDNLLDTVVDTVEGVLDGVLGVTDHLTLFKNLLGGIPLGKVRSQQKRFISCLDNLLNGIEIELLPLLSIQLALHGINGFSHPCSQPIHLAALNLLKIRADIDIDLDLVNLANLQVNIDADVVIPGVVDISADVNVCGNHNFGQCGVEGTCWKWVCGGCAAEACKQRDCACDCQGESSLACINIAATSCAAPATCSAASSSSDDSSSSSSSGGLLGGVLGK